MSRIFSQGSFIFLGRMCQKNCQISTVNADYYGYPDEICNRWGMIYPAYFYVDQLYDLRNDPNEVLFVMISNHMSGISFRNHEKIEIMKNSQNCQI